MAYSVTTERGLMRPEVEAQQAPDEMAPCVREVLTATGALDAVERALHDLDKRLYQVLRPASPEPDEPALAREHVSPLHDALRDVTDRIGRLELRIHGLTSRLTV